MSNVNLGACTAYSIALAHGFEGTEAEWLASLKGDTGPQGATGPQGPAGASAKPTVRTLTLSTAGWDSTDKTQMVTCSGVLSDETAQLITVTPAQASQSAYLEAGVRCTAQATDALIFTASTVPTVELTVYAVIQTM